MHEGTRGYEFGPFQLDCLNHRVLRDGRPVSLTPKAVDTLRFLIEHRDRVLSKDELLKALWPDSFVEEANLAQHVFTLRKTLGTQPDGAPYIETIPKRGYRFAANATEFQASVTESVPDTPPAIAVRSRPARLNIVRWGALAASLALIVALSTVYVRAVRQQRLLTSVIGAVETAAAANNFEAAHATLEAAGIDPGDPKLAAISDRIAGSISISTAPATAVLASRLDLARQPSTLDVINLGQTPVVSRRLVAGEYVIELSGSGVQSVRMLVQITPGKDLRVERTLVSSSASLEEMVPVEAGDTRWMNRVATVPAFLIDSHEVTNSAFQQFVEAGRYHDSSLWPEALIVDGQPVPWARAMARFVDRTGLPGPRTWSDGRYPEGKGDHPVVGVSWYEATAYAKWKGKQLPSFEEWRRAAVNGAESGFPWGSDVKTAELRANFSLLGTTPVEAHPGGLSPFGCTDMAGNAREWLREESEGMRHPAAGGSWLEPSYDFEHAEWFDAAQASPGIGFRLMSRMGENQERETATLLPPPGSVPEHASNDAWIRRPANNQEFDTLSKFLAYDARLPFDVKLIDVKNDAGVIVEHLTFQSSPGTRVSTLLMHAGETSGRPGIILLHSAGAKGKDLPNNISLGLSMARAGWSVIAIDLPYFGERATELLTAYSDEEKHAQLYNQPGVYLGWLTQAVRDTRRAFDLLIERTSADPNRVALVGASRGAIVGMAAAGVDKRFSPVVLLFGGHATPLELEHLEPACPANYIGRIAPRPLLMLNSVNDQTFPPDGAVRPLFALASRPKEIIWTDTGHMVLTEEDTARVMGWLRSKLN